MNTHIGYCGDDGFELPERLKKLLAWMGPPDDLHYGELPTDFPADLRDDADQVFKTLGRLTTKKSRGLGRTWMKWRAHPYFLGKPRQHLEQVVRIVFGRSRAALHRDLKLARSWERIKRLAGERSMDFNTLSVADALRLVTTPRKKAPGKDMAIAPAGLPRPGEWAADEGDAGEPVAGPGGMVPIGEMRELQQEISEGATKVVQARLGVGAVETEFLVFSPADVPPGCRDKILIRYYFPAWLTRRGGRPAGGEKGGAL